MPLTWRAAIRGFTVLMPQFGTFVAPNYWLALGQGARKPAMSQGQAMSQGAWGQGAMDPGNQEPARS